MSGPGAAAGPEGATRVAAVALLRAAARGEPCGVLRLVVREASGASRRVELGDELTVGRGPAAALRLDDGGVSRLHARFRVGPDGGVTVEDLGSKNGVRRNGAALGREPAPLAPGDEVVIGETRLVLEDPLGEAAEGEGGGRSTRVAPAGSAPAEVDGPPPRPARPAPSHLLAAGSALFALAGVLLLAG